MTSFAPPRPTSPDLRVLTALLFLGCSVGAGAAPDDRDRDGLPDGQDRPRESRERDPISLMAEAAGESCGLDRSVPYPYCHTGLGAGLTLRPAQGTAPRTLAFLTQTTFEDDVVWLQAGDVTTEEARCSPQRRGGVPLGIIPNDTIGALAYNDLIGCSGTDTLFAAGGTNSVGWINETAVYSPPTVTSANKCAGGASGDDNLAEPAGDDCTYLRRFGFSNLAKESFPGAGDGDSVDAMAVMDLAPGVLPPLLAVAVREDQTIYFVDPSTPSCAAEIDVAELGSCQVASPLRPTQFLEPKGMAWAGGTQLFVSDVMDDFIYLLDVDPLTFECTIIDQCPSPGPNIQALAYDRSTNQLYAADDELNLIFFGQFTSPCPDPSPVGTETYIPFFREDPMGTNDPGTVVLLHNPNTVDADILLHVHGTDGSVAASVPLTVVGQGNQQLPSLFDRVRLGTYFTGGNPQLGNIQIETLGPSGIGVLTEAVTGQIFALGDGDAINAPEGFILQAQAEASTTLVADYFFSRRGGGANFNYSSFLSIMNPDDVEPAVVSVAWFDVTGTNYNTTVHAINANGNAVIHTGDSTGIGCPGNNPNFSDIIDGSVIVTSLPNENGFVAPIAGAVVTFDNGVCLPGDLPTHSAEHPKLGADMRTEKRRENLP